MSTALVLTLGHNSSAILVEDGNVIAGYEEERFTGKKSDSSFPRNAITELSIRFNIPTDVKVCIGHWFLDHNLPMDTKYWDPDFINQLFPDNEILSIDHQFTHHDSHLESAISFSGSNFTPNYHALVIDGFGSSGECISVYEVKKGGYQLLRRWFGFDKSLGLLYQYATAFLGMQMHNHEYKMLAYEVHLHSLQYDVDLLNGLVAEHADERIKNLYSSEINVSQDPLVSSDALINTRLYIENVLSGVLSKMNAESVDIHDKRCIISYFVQKVVETVVLHLVEVFNVENVLLSGGLFYNVKLNSLISKKISGKTCIIPLAGDQGAGLGVYQRYFGDLKWPNHLNWGVRDLNFESDHDKMVIVDDMSEALPIIRQQLNTVGFVNLVRGNMEFGPRALCNTSTLALPIRQIGEIINKINDRTNEMPFALVVSKEQSEKMFENCEKIHRSLDYMICTRDFKPYVAENNLGGAHYYPDLNIYTCRPQITDDEHILDLLEQFGPLINTSFNFHGVPIVLGEEQIKYTHKMQCQTAPDVNFLTIIVRN